jgi:hypothetical protein
MHMHPSAAHDDEREGEKTWSEAKIVVIHDACIWNHVIVLGSIQTFCVHRPHR